MKQLEFSFMDDVETVSTLHPCNNLHDFLEVEMGIMKRHLDEHKYFQHIADSNKATVDFIEKYGWIMRELYCGYACPKRKDCFYYNSIQ